MNKRLSLLILLVSMGGFLYIFDIYLSSRVNDITNTEYACYLRYTKNCKITSNTRDHNMQESNYYLESVGIESEYDYVNMESDLDITENYSRNLVQRDANVLNQDMYYLANQIKDSYFSNLDRAHDYYPSKYKRSSAAIKILAVSDSYGVGAGLINNNDSWPGVLESNLLSKGLDIEVSKMVKNGADFPDYLEMLSRANINLLDPDIIVLSLFQNDLGPISWVSKPEYLRCLSAGLGDNGFDRFARDNFAYIYSFVLSKRCDAKKLENFAVNKINNKDMFFVDLESDPLAKWYKDTMKEILKNADGRPVIIQPLFDGENDSYYNIKEVLKYLSSIGYIIPNFNIDEVFEYSKFVGYKKIHSLYPVDIHYSRLFNNYLAKMSVTEILKIISKDEEYDILKRDLSKTPSIIVTSPRTFISDANLLLQYERRETPIVVSKLSSELIRGGVNVGDVIDEVLCTSINRAHVRVYLNQEKHIMDNLVVENKKSESQIAVAGIYYSPEGEELFTEIEILKPGDEITFSNSKKIVGIFFGAPLSGCSEDELWKMPSFLAQLRYF